MKWVRLAINNAAEFFNCELGVPTNAEISIAAIIVNAANERESASNVPNGSYFAATYAEIRPLRVLQISKSLAGHTGCWEP